MQLLLLATALSLFSVGYCDGNSNYTVTEECWFEVEVKDLDGPGEDYRGTFVIGVFGDSAPMTALNFVSLTKGFTKNKKKLHYKNTKIHRIVPDFVVQMGDVTIGDGTGGTSIYGDQFNDEDFKLSHRAPGMVAMANHGPDTNGSQFYILLSKARWLDKKHVVFGKVIKGMDVIKALGEVPSDKDTAVPKHKVKIVDCGINNIDQKYTLTEADVDRQDDL